MYERLDHERRPVRRFAAPLALAALVVCSAVARAWVNRRFQAPQLLCDEFIYGGIAKSLATTGHLRLRGETASGLNLLYPTMIAPAWFAHRMATTYSLAKSINSILVSLTAIPVYFWARRVVSAWWALLAAALVLLLPALVLSGMLMSENAALPAFAFGLLAVGLVVERPTLWRQALVAVALPVAFEARTENIDLLAVLPTALALRLVLDARAGVGRRELVRGLRAYIPLEAVLAAATIAYVVRNGLSTQKILGSYEAVTYAHYSVRGVALWTLRHGGEAVLAVGVVPACALVLMLGLGVARRLERPEERALVATAAAATLSVLVVAGAFAGSLAHWVMERYSFYAFPPLLVVFVLWLARGLPRPPLPTAVAVVVPLAFVPFVVLGPYLGTAGVYDTLTLHLFTRVSVHVPGGLTGARLTILVVAGAIALFFAGAPVRVARPALPVGVAALLVVASHAAYGNLVQYSLLWSNTTGPVRSWIDQAVGTEPNRVGYLYVVNSSVANNSAVLVNTEFWNRSIGDVFTLGTPQLCSLPARVLRVDKTTGELVKVGTAKPVKEQYMVTDKGLAIAAREVASGGPTLQPLRVYRQTGSLRLASQISGVYADGWSGAQAAFRQYWAPRPRPGSLVLTMGRLSWKGPDLPGHVVVMVRRLGRVSAPTVVRRWTAHSGKATTMRLPVPPPPFEADVRVRPTFSPTPGEPGTRRLGVQIGFSYESR